MCDKALLMELALQCESVERHSNGFDSVAAGADSFDGPRVCFGGSVEITSGPVELPIDEIELLWFKIGVIGGGDSDN
jgi:hypothetical protein